MSRVLAVVLLAFAGLLPAGALAVESPRRGSFELRLIPYHPNIDAEFNGKTIPAPPYREIFGGGKKLMLRADVAWSVLKGFGTLDLGVGAGYVQARGRARLPGGGPSGDSSALRIIPTALTLTYRLDQLANYTRWFPFAPYGRVALERYNWWAPRGSGGVGDANGRHGTGATNGYSYAGGVAFLLDAIDPGLARDLDNSTGINHTYLYAEASRAKIDDFGSSKSFDLSPQKGTLFGFGMLFVF